MPCDTDAFLADIEACHGSAVIGGAEACPAVEDAARAHGAECLHTPMFSNGPPYAYSVCRRGAGAGVREICAAAGHVVGPPAQPQSRPAQAGMSAGAIGAIGATGVVTTAGLVAAGLRSEFRKQNRHAASRYKIESGEYIPDGRHQMKFTEWLRGGTREGQPVKFKKLLRSGLPGVNTTWDFESRSEYDTWYEGRYNTKANESATWKEKVHDNFLSFMSWKKKDTPLGENEI